MEVGLFIHLLFVFYEEWINKLSANRIPCQHPCSFPLDLSCKSDMLLTLLKFFPRNPDSFHPFITSWAAKGWGEWNIVCGLSSQLHTQKKENSLTHTYCIVKFAESNSQNVSTVFPRNGKGDRSWKESGEKDCCLLASKQSADQSQLWLHSLSKNAEIWEQLG